MPSEQEVIDLTQAWMEAVQRKDTETLERILAPEYTYMASGQGKLSRDEWLDLLRIYDLHGFEFVETDIRRYADVAIVMSRYRQTASVGGVPRTGEFLITDVWTIQEGSWRVVARSSILLPVTSEAGLHETNKAAIRRLFDEVFGAGKVDSVAELVADNVLGHDPTDPKPKRGPENVQQVAVLFRTAFPDLRLTVEDVIAEGDKVAAHWTLRGTHQGSFMGIPATGKTASTTGITIYRLAQGKITEYWGSFDALGLMRQLGAPYSPPER